MCNKISPVFGKTVVVDYQGYVYCNYMEKEIPIKLFYFSYDSKSKLTVNQIEAIISHLHQKDICPGVKVKDKNLKFKISVTFIDPLNKWRHNNCNFILTQNENIYAKCKLINQTFNNNRNRKNKQKKPLKRIRFKVTPSKTNKSKLLRSRLDDK